MILIFSRDIDTTTDLVINWLCKWNIPFTRINGELYEDIFVDFDSNKIMIKGRCISEYNVVWFRKHSPVLNDKTSEIFTKKIYKNIVNFNYSEAIAFREFLFNQLQLNKEVLWLTKPFKATENKLIQLKLSEKYGLKIPKTYVLTSKDDLESLLKKNAGEEFITKPFKNCLHLKHKQKSIMMKTTVINEHIKNFPKNFPPALIQKRVIRKNEVRVFFIMGKFFATKITGEDDKEVDHRVNMLSLKGRFQNFNLPIDIKKKLLKVLDELELNCASIDLLIDENDDFIFLEINPTGQFMYHSVFNNSYLEREIALALKKLYEKNRKKQT